MPGLGSSDPVLVRWKWSAGFLILISASEERWHESDGQGQGEFR